MGWSEHAHGVGEQTHAHRARELELAIECEQASARLFVLHRYDYVERGDYNMSKTRREFSALLYSSAHK